MKEAFLPLGYKPQTEEQILMTEHREKLYEYYGIPYGVFDGSKQDIKNVEMEQDRTTAWILIMQEKEIPKDLEERLLIYKKQDKYRKNRS